MLRSRPSFVVSDAGAPHLSPPDNAFVFKNWNTYSFKDFEHIFLLICKNSFNFKKMMNLLVLQQWEPQLQWQLRLEPKQGSSGSSQGSSGSSQGGSGSSQGGSGSIQGGSGSSQGGSGSSQGGSGYRGSSNSSQGSSGSSTLLACTNIQTLILKEHILQRFKC